MDRGHLQINVPVLSLHTDQTLYEWESAGPIMKHGPVQKGNQPRQDKPRHEYAADQDRHQASFGQSGDMFHMTIQTQSNPVLFRTLMKQLQVHEHLQALLPFQFHLLELRQF